MYFGKQRKLNRWQGYDYSMPRFYFVTICSQKRICCFGDIVDNKMILNELGDIIKQQWLWLSQNYDYISLDEWQIMPNHIHGIIEIINKDYDSNGKIFTKPHKVGNVLERSLHNQGTPKILPLYRVIGAFKTTSAKLINQENGVYFKWQKSFHDRVIRSEQELNNIRYYIQQNPINWQSDRNNPANIK